MPDGYILEIKRIFDAPRERVFRAWTDPDQMREWWGPEGRDASHVELDARPGGRWRTCMKSRADGHEAWCQGEFREVTPPERLVFTWAWETDGMPGNQTLVTIEFLDLGGRTEMHFWHEGFPDEEAKNMHNEGWTSSLVCLEEHLSKGE